MILFINIKLTNGKIGTYNRGHLPSSSSLEIFKYMMLSLKDLYPWKKACLNIVVDPATYSDVQKNELFTWLTQLFEGKTLILNDTRCEFQPQWQAWCNEHIDGNDLVFFLANHDHIFYSNNTQYFQTLIERFQAIYGETHGAIYFSHWPELIGRTIHTPMVENLFFVTPLNLQDSIQIFTAPTFKKLWFDGHFETLFLPRLDWNPYANPNDFMRPTVVPKIELFRHFDGYTHSPTMVLPMNEYYFSYALSIPVGIFQNDIQISIGANDNPLWTTVDVKSNYRVNDPKGCDVRGISKNIPYFWKPRISKTHVHYNELSPENLEANAALVTHTVEQYRLAFGRHYRIPPSDPTAIENAKNIVNFYLNKIP